MRPSPLFSPTAFPPFLTLSLPSKVQGLAARPGFCPKEAASSAVALTMEMYLNLLTDARLMTFQLAHATAPRSYDKAWVSLAPRVSAENAICLHFLHANTASSFITFIARASGSFQILKFFPSVAAKGRTPVMISVGRKMIQVTKVPWLGWTVFKKFISLSCCWQKELIPSAGRQQSKALSAHCTFPRT